MKVTIGVFDSGIGGEAVAKELAVSFVNATITVVNDRNNIPYGSKSPKKVQTLTRAAIQPLLGHDVVVLACNTATALALPYLRSIYPDQKFIGIEPMLKPAANLTKSRIICVCATPATLASQRYRAAKQRYATTIKVVEPDCSLWASMIEQNALSEERIVSTIEPVLAQGADIIVLGCTHYHWIKERIQAIAQNRAQVLEPSEAIARQVAQLLRIRS